MGIRGEVFSSKMNTENRSYFFNVKENRRGELFLSIVESKKHGDQGFERRSVMVFEEELEKFASELQKAVDYMRDNKKR